MATTPIKGELFVLSIYDGAAYRPIACLTSNSLDMTREVISIQTKCDPGLTIKQAGSLDYSIECEGNYIDTTSVGAEVTKASHDYLFNIMQAGTDLEWRMATNLADTAFYYGTAILTNLPASFPSGNEFATFSATLDGSGAIVTVDPNP